MLLEQSKINEGFFSYNSNIPLTPGLSIHFSVETNARSSGNCYNDVNFLKIQNQSQGSYKESLKGQENYILAKRITEKKQKNFGLCEFLLNF